MSKPFNQLIKKKLPFTPLFFLLMEIYFYSDKRGSKKKKKRVASVKRNSSDRCPCKSSRHFNGCLSHKTQSLMQALPREAVVLNV